ncbi:MAG: LysR family transcriptional regulator, partial [Myxococcales bacterium]|nr:LysR family transcriptional regulator [Myxococcales bacterium]
WDQVRLFLAVARGGTLAAAATRLGLDVSTVSRRLDRLEDDLGIHLFDRGRDGAVATAAAEQMLPHAEEMELGLVRFAAAGAQVETEVEGVVRLTVPPGVADAFIAPLLPELHARHPRLLIELDASISYADLTRREADVALRTTRPTSGDLIVTRLVETRSMPMTSPAYAAELGRLRRLADARWIDWGADLAHLPSARWLRKHGPEVVPVLRTSHFASALAAARAGLGLALASEPYRLTGLVPVPPGRALTAAWAELPLEALWLVGHRPLRHVPRVAAVWDFLLERMSSVPEPG